MATLPLSQQGVVLLEALIAILVFSMGVLAIVGLQATMIKNTNDTQYRSQASNIAQQKIGLIWADPDPTRIGWVSPVEEDTDISNLLPDGTLSIAMPAAGEYMVTVTWKQPGDSEIHNLSTTAYVNGG